MRYRQVIETRGSWHLVGRPVFDDPLLGAASAWSFCVTWGSGGHGMTMLPAQSDTAPPWGHSTVGYSSGGRRVTSSISLVRDDKRGQWGVGSPLNEFSYYRPTLWQFQGRSYIAWTGTDDSALLNVMSSADGQVIDRSAKVTLRGGSQYGPALVTDGAAFYLVWVGGTPPHSVRVTSSPDGLTFNYADQIVFGPPSIPSPALAANTSDGAFHSLDREPSKGIRMGQLVTEEGERGTRSKEHRLCRNLFLICRLIFRGGWLQLVLT
jgi:hypothetical protein